MAREAPVESWLRSRIEDVGGACEKHVGGMRGDPDRVCSFPNGYHCLAETKWLEDVKPYAIGGAALVALGIAASLAKSFRS